MCAGVAVRRKPSQSLNVSASERSALQTELTGAKAQLDLQSGEAFLLDGHYDQALASLREAGGSRLRLAPLGLKGCATSDASDSRRVDRGEALKSRAAAA
jgi:hypothetical protein